MTCYLGSKRLLHATGLGLAGMLVIAGCGGGSSPPIIDASVPPPHDSAAPPPPKLDAPPASGPEVLAPVLSVTPGALAFGDVDLQTTSPPLDVTVTNSGGLAPISASITQSPGFVIVGTTCNVPSATCKISVSFAPPSVGGVSGTLTIGTGLTVSLSGTGKTPGTFSVVPGTVPSPVLVNTSVPITASVTTTTSALAVSCLPSGAELTADPTNTTCPAIIPAKTPCVFAFTFKSTTPGQKTASIVCSSGADVRTLPVNTTVVSPATLSLAPNPGTFSTAVNSPSAVITFSLTNSGGSPSGALSAALGGVDAALFTITDNKCGGTLAANSSCAIQVVFNPTAAGSKTASLTVTDATPGSVAATTVLTGNAISAPTAVITGTPNLGSVLVGQIGTASTFTLTNSGGAATGVLTVATGDTAFVLGSDLCSGQPLSAGKTCTFTVTFAPKSEGPKSAVLTVSSAGTTLGTLQIQGTGVRPAVLTMTPPTLDFPTTGVGGSSAAKSFTVTNTGGTATGALSVVRRDGSVGGAAQFTFTSTCQAALAANATCLVYVTYAPNAAGAASATFAVGDGTISTPVGSVTGTALAVPGMTISCLPATFENTAVGQTSAAVVCTVGNATNSAQPTGTLTTTTAGDFAVVATSSNCSATLAAGATCTLSVVFKPTLKGKRDGSVTVAGSNGGTATQNLTGTGLGVIEIQEFVPPTTAGSYTPTLVAAGNYDFGTVSAGATSDTTVVLAVFVRGPVGNLTVDNAFGAPADFTQLAGAVDLKWPDSDAAHTSVGACIGKTTTAPPANQTVPYCTVTVKFTPQTKTPAQKTGTVTASGANTATDAATVRGTAAGPLSIDPSPATLGAVSLGHASAPQVLTICNNATTNATAASFTLAGPNAADFAVTQDGVSGATIPGRTAAGAVSCVYLTLLLDVPATETATSLNATLTVRATIAGVVESDTAALSGTVTGAAVLTATLDSPTFAPTPITATSGARTVTVTNTGGMATDTLNFTIPPGSEFTMLDTDGSPKGTCPLTCTSGLVCTATALASAQSCTVKVWFKPTGALGVGQRSDRWTVASTMGGIAVVALAGSATSQITASPATFTLGLASTDGVPLPKQAITVQNYGAAIPANQLDFKFQDFGTQIGQASAAFQFADNNCTGTIAETTGNCTINVEMKTGIEGTFSTTVVVTNLVNGQSDSVVVTGTAVKPATLVFTPATAMNRSFGAISAATTSTPITYTVTNVGGFTSGKLTFALYDEAVDGGTVPGATAHVGDFNYLTPTGSTVCTSGTTTLDPGKSCDIVLQFAPTNTTASSLTEFLVVKGTGAPAAGLGIDVAGTLPRITATALAATAGLVFLTAPDPNSPNGPYDFGLPPATGTTKDVVLVIHNNSGAVANLTVPTFAAGNTDFAYALATGTTPPPCSFAAGSTLGNAISCSFIVRWTPGVTAGVTQTTTVTTSGASMVLYGRRPGLAVLTAKPADVNLGNARVGADSTAQIVVVTNTGESPTGNIAESHATAGFLRSADLTVGTGCTRTGAGTLAPGASCNLSVQTHPVAATPDSVKNARIQLNPDSGATLNILVSWQGTNAPAINATPANLDNFAATAVLASTARTLTLTNPANGEQTGPLTFTVDNANFSVDAVAGTNKCGDAAFAVSGLNPSNVATGFCTVTVTFSPTALGATTAARTKQGTLTVTSGSGAKTTVSLTGTALPALSLDSERVATTAEDGQRTGTGCDYAGGTCTYRARATTVATFDSETFIFANAVGAPPTGLLMTDLAGDYPGQYRIVTDTCRGRILATGGAANNADLCNVTVRFEPTRATANMKATLTVSGTPGDSVVVNLTGSGQ